MKTVVGVGGVVLLAVLLANGFVKAPTVAVSSVAETPVKRDIKGFRLGMTYEEAETYAKQIRTTDPALSHCRGSLKWVYGEYSLKDDRHDDAPFVNWFSSKYKFSRGPVASFCDYFTLYFTRHIKPLVIKAIGYTVVPDSMDSATFKALEQRVTKDFGGSPSSSDSGSKFSDWNLSHQRVLLLTPSRIYLIDMSLDAQEKSLKAAKDFRPPPKL